eukprot:2859604-Prymnesium_polylepis.1
MVLDVARSRHALRCRASPLPFRASPFCDLVDFGLTELGPGGFDLARACRLVDREGDAPPEGGLGSP